jgi:cytochrome b6
MFRVVLTGSYKRPREFNWCVGVVLLVLTLLLSFTGYLLPDDQLGFWAVTVGTNMARATPMLGSEGPFGPQLGMTPFNDVRFGLLGGSIVDANALLRSYIWHCIGIPLVASIFMAVHFWRIRKDGGISGPAPVVLENEVKPPKKPSVLATIGNGSKSATEVAKPAAARPEPAAKPERVEQ